MVQMALCILVCGPLNLVHVCILVCGPLNLVHVCILVCGPLNLVHVCILVCGPLNLVHVCILVCGLLNLVQHCYGINVLCFFFVTIVRSRLQTSSWKWRRRSCLLQVSKATNGLVRGETPSVKLDHTCACVYVAVCLVFALEVSSSGEASNLSFEMSEADL